MRVTKSFKQLTEKDEFFPSMVKGDVFCITGGVGHMFLLLRVL